MKTLPGRRHRTLGRAGLIIYLIYLSASVAPVTLKAGHTDGGGWCGGPVMPTKIRQKGGSSEATASRLWDDDTRVCCDQGRGMSQATRSLLLIKDQSLQMIHLFRTLLRIQRLSGAWLARI